MSADPRTDFAEEVAGLASDLLGATVEHDSAEFSLRITPPGSHPVVLHLDNLYAETRLLSDEERGFRIRAAIWACAPDSRAATWQEAATRLLPAVRPAASVLSGGPNPLRRPLVPFVDLVVTVDLGHSISLVVYEDLASWQVDARTAFSTAIQNLSDTGLQLEPVDSGFVVISPDSYGSAWLGLPELVGEVSSSLGGPHLLVAPSRDALRLVPLHDDEAVAASVERALSDYQNEPRPVSPVPYVVVDEELRPWAPPVAHPAHELVRVAKRVLADDAYSAQQEFLREAFASAADPTRLASHMLVTHRDDGHIWSWTLWSAEEGESLLPRADFVLLAHPEDTDTHFAVAWDDLLAAAGCLREEGGYPAPLWRASGPPPRTVVSTLAGMAVEFPPRFEGVAGRTP
jgi:hypothetical protein